VVARSVAAFKCNVVVGLTNTVGALL
jgi:hypothetical protein